MSRSLHVVAGLARAHGGPSYSVPRLCRALEEQGSDVSLVSVAQEDETDLFPARTFKQDHPTVPALSRLRLSQAMKEHLAVEVSNADIVHNHGLWLAPNIYAGISAAKANTRLVVSPRGMLANNALQFSSWKKRLLWAFAQGPALRSAAGWHATSEDEVDDIRRFGVRDCPVAVIPNGVDLPSQVAAHQESKAMRTILFLSRVHPKKGLPDLVTAWSRLAPSLPGWRVVIAGPDEGGHTAQLQQQARSLGADRIEFVGAVFGDQRDALYAGSDLYVLPTQNENFGIAVAEALAAGLPAIVSKGAPWAGLESKRCGWWIDHGADPLEAALREATGLSAGQRREMGEAGQAWVAAAFSWSTIADRMDAYYRWLLGRGERPACVAG